MVLDRKDVGNDWKIVGKAKFSIYKNKVQMKPLVRKKLLQLVQLVAKYFDFKASTSIWYRTVARKFSVGRLYVCSGGLETLKYDKTPPIYSPSLFNLRGLGALFVGANSPKAPRGHGTDLVHSLLKHKRQCMSEIILVGLLCSHPDYAYGFMPH